MTLTDAAAIGQVVATALAAVGIAVSLWMARETLKEVQEDRRLRFQPHLLFEAGGWRLPVEFVKAGRAVPGIDPDFAAKILSDLPENMESVRLQWKEPGESKSPPSFYGNLTNFGSGPALDTKVTFVPKFVWVGSDKFEVDSKKLREPVYSAGLNTMPAVPRNILPGKSSKLTRLPTFIEKDHEKKISRVEGALLIDFQDTFGTAHRVVQEVSLFTQYRESSPTVHVSFGDSLDRQPTHEG